MEAWTNIPLPGPAGVVAWVLCGLGVAAALTGRRSVAAASAVAAGLVSLLAGWLPTVAPTTVGEAALGWMVASGTVVHGALAVIVAVLAARARPPRRADGRWTLAAATGAIGLSVGLGVVADGFTVPLALLMLGGAASVVALVGGGVRELPAALVVGVLLVVAADWGAQAAVYERMLGGQLHLHEPAIGAAWRGVVGVRVAAPGVIAAVVLATLLGGARRWDAPAPSVVREGAPVVAGLLVVLAAWSALPARQLADAGRLGPPPALRAAWWLPAEAACIAHVPVEGPVRRVARWPRGCETPERVGVRIDGERSARELLQDWGTERIEVLVHGRGGQAPPLRQLGVGAAPMRVLDDPVPHRFDPDEGVTLQLDAWLDTRLGRRPDLAPGHVWIVDSPQGTLLLLHGTGVTAGGRAVRREMFERLLAGVDDPALALVVADGWSVSDVVAICSDARVAADVEVPCVLMAAR